MPTVPTYDNFQVGANALPQVRIDAPQPIDTAAQQAQRTGQAMQSAGEAGMRVATDAQNEANQLRVIDVSNQAKEHMFNLLYDQNTGALQKKGWDALNSPSGKGLADDTGDAFKEITGELSDSLANDQQRQMFAQQAASMHSQLYGTVLNHVGQEFKTYNSGVMDASVATAQREIGLMGVSGQIPTDPNTGRSKLDDAADRIYAAARQKARLVGLPQSLADETARQQVSAGYTQAIEAALQNGNVPFANTFLQQKKDDMTPADILRTQGMVTKEMNGRMALGAVQKATASFTPQFQPTDIDRLTGIVRGMESGGRETNPDGTPLTSAKGAQGSMQVMPGTNKAPGFGVAPAKDDSADERARVGRDYLGAMVQRYGNAPQAMAAYNAGPGALDEAVKKAADAGTPNAWLTYLPKETQSYVATGMKKFQSGQGTAPIPSELDFTNHAIAQLGPNPTAEQVAATRQVAEHQYGLLTKAVTQKQEQSVMQVQQALQANGGDINGIDPVLRSQVPPGKWDDLIKYANVIQRPDHQTNMAAYNRAVTYPEELAAMSDQQFDQFATLNFSRSDQKTVADIRAKEINGKEDTSAESVNTKAMTTALNNRLLAMGINPTPKPTDMKAKEQIGTMQKFVRDSIFQQQLNTGKKMTPGEIESHIDGLFAKNLQFRRTFAGVDVGGMTQQMLSMKVGDIPGSELSALRQKFAASGQTKPSDDQILRLYWTWKNKNG